MNRIKVINTGFLVISFSLVLLSLWKTFIQSDFIPYLPLLAGSTLSFLMFVSLLLAGGDKRVNVLWLFVALIASGLMVVLYVFPELLKELYPLQIWLSLAVIISSIQSALDRKRKRFHLHMRYLNYGLLIVLIPTLFLKVGTPWIWTFLSIFTLLAMILNLVIFVLPTKSGQSR